MALIKCPCCGHTVSDKATRCPNCGDPLTPVDSGTQWTAQQTNPEQPIGSQPQAPNPAPKPPTVKSGGKSGNGGAIAIIVGSVVIIAIAIIAYFAFAYKSPGSSDSDTWEYPDTETVEEDAVADYDKPFNTNLTEDELEDAIQSANSEMPQIIEQGMRMDEILLDGNYVTYVCTIDEAIYSISDIRESHNEIKQTMLNNLKNTTDDDIRTFVSMCKSHNKGIAYRYVGDETGNTHTIYIRPSEL